MIKKSGYYIVIAKHGQEYRVKADTYSEAVNKVIEHNYKCNLEDIIDANPEYVER